MVDDGPPVEDLEDGCLGCASEEDCIGSGDDHLVQHDSSGDLYCESCWDSFFVQNPNLECLS